MVKTKGRRFPQTTIQDKRNNQHNNGHQRIRTTLALAILTLLTTVIPANAELPSVVVAMEGSMEAADSAASTATAAAAEDTLAAMEDSDDEYSKERIDEDDEESSQQTAQQQHPCHWGNPECHHRDAASNGGGSGENRSTAYSRYSDSHSSSVSGSEQQVQTADTIESVIKKAAARSGDAEKAESVHNPPEGFSLSARVLTDHETGLSYFAPLSSPLDLQIPFLECGAVGSTTEPIEIKHGTFRHFPSGAVPSAFTTSPHPQLVVALHPLELTVSGNGEESRVFLPGDVILLEDTMGKGHKMRALASAGSCAADMSHGEERDLSVFMLTLPHHHHHHHHQYHHQSQGGEKGKISHHLSVFGLSSKHKKKNNGGTASSSSYPEPCENEYDPAYSALLPRNGGFPNPFRLENLSKILFGSIGASLSSLAVIKMFKVVPIVISVGFGGACLVGGGTCAIVLGGEKLMDEYNIRCEEKRYKMNEMNFKEEIKEKNQGGPVVDENEERDDDNEKQEI